MKSTTQRARRALLVAFGIATTTFQLGWSGVAFADQFGGLLDSQAYSTVQQIAYQNDGSDLEENVPDAPGAKQAESEISDQAEEISATLEERFAALDERFEDFEESIDEIAEVSGDKQIVKSGSSKSTMVISGRVHFDAWGFDDRSPNIGFFENPNDSSEPSVGGEDPDNRLGFRRLRFGVKGKIRDNMQYKIEMELAGGNRSEFRDAYLGWNDLPYLQTVLLGNQKRPYGLDHLNSSRYNVFLERPFVIEANNQDARRLGLASYGVSDNQAWNWRYGVYNQENVQATGNYSGDHLQLEFAGRLANTIWYDEISGGRGYAHWAISGTHADSTPGPDNEARWRTRPEARSIASWINTGFVAGADHFEQLGWEGVVNVGALQVVGEYQSVWLDRDGFADTNWQGGYVYASYFLTGEHMPWDRKSGTLARPVPFQNFWVVDRCDGCRDAGWGAWQIAARYSVADYTDQDVFGGEGESFTFGLNWYWNANARMQFNYINGEIKNRDVDDNPAVVDARSGSYDIYGARFMVDF
jgi:phosphate-selective porin OprO/OprP